ncbi:sugar-binding protein [Kiritimatiellota bacterium B12222]|nr:sugar-binding protein [Kiritimatiellota bacterium B12222]
MNKYFAFICSLLCLLSFAHAQDAVSLMKPGEPHLGWTFNNGPEFPGAKGSLEIDPTALYNGQQSLKLTGDFRNGGNYVQAATTIDGVDIRELFFWVKGQDSDRLTLRVIDANNRCHQIRLRTQVDPGWQRISFPLERYFANQGTSAGATTSIVKYESWGGNKEEQSWKGPAKKLVILLGRQSKEDAKAHTIWINKVTIIPRPITSEADAKASAGVPTTLRLDEVIEGEHFWSYTNGPEFKGAKATLTLLENQPEAGMYAMKLTGDFTEGGGYVAVSRDLTEFGMKDLISLNIRYKSENLTRVGVQLKDGSGQIHQVKNIPVISDGQWHTLRINPLEIAGGEHWGGAKDGKWHGAPQYFHFGVAKPGGDREKIVSFAIADIQAEALMPGHSDEVVYQMGFEALSTLPNTWKASAGVAVEDTEAFKGEKVLALRKTDATLHDEVSVIGPTFPVSQGRYEFKFATSTDLKSMDNSYRGVLGVEFLSGSGAVVGKETLAEPFRKSPWKPGSKQVDIPAGASQARFTARINKEAPGVFRVDDLSVASMAVERKDDRIQRLTFRASELGHLLFPESSRIVEVEVLANKPLPAEQREVLCELRDYWGAEQSATLPVTLTRAGRQKSLFVYKGTVDLSAVPMELGRYYELHGRIEREDANPFTYYTTLAILPEAPANAFPPEVIPFTSRNWDNRMEAYVRLTHRLGIRICGVWGSFKAEPPYKTQAPQLNLVEELGMGWLTSTPAGLIERRSKGYEKYTEESLRAGMRQFLADYGHIRPLIINLGNEPHNKGDEIDVDVDAYRILYSEIKSIDPTITVVGTSVGATEGYFAAGMGEWLDAYDFHTYEDVNLIRKIVQQRYPDLFEKYGFAKPIWSTEVGLNSQGMDRQQVAGTLYKKFVNFFAVGGANISWFGLLYPDPQGKNADSFGSAHNVFDCRFNIYAPKLDAIAYYNAVNAIADKQFVDEQSYGEDIQAFLFQNDEGQALQVWYTEKSQSEVFVPLAGVGKVQAIRIDGSRSDLNADGKGLSLSVSTDPVVLLYDGGPAKLAKALGTPAIRMAKVPDMIVRGEKSSFDVELVNADADQVSLKAPPMWRIESEATQDAEGRSVVRFTVEAPVESAVRAADMVIELAGKDGQLNGQLFYRPGVTGTVSMELLPVAAVGEQAAAVRVRVHNNSPMKQQVTWDVVLTGEQELENGGFTQENTTSAYFSDTQSSSLELEGKESFEAIIPIADADLYKVYRVRASVRDAANRVTVKERPVAAFYGVEKVDASLTIDGKLNEADWATASVRSLDQENQFFALAHAKPLQTWEGPQDLSTEIRYLWDDEYLYLGISVTDDIAGILQEDSRMWFQDGLQFLVDPMRTSDHKIGKYDYSLGMGLKGLQAWCHLSADADAPTGNVEDFIMASQAGAEGTGSRVYEIAIPWSRLAPFTPEAGGNLGFTLILNEDDGNNRDSFMTWFGNAHNKDVDVVGDLLLLP